MKVDIFIKVFAFRHLRYDHAIYLYIFSGYKFYLLACTEYHDFKSLQPLL